MKLTKRHKTAASADNKADDKSDNSKDKETKEIKPEVRVETIQPLMEGPSKAKNIKRKAKLIKTPIIGTFKMFQTCQIGSIPTVNISPHLLEKYYPKN